MSGIGPEAALAATTRRPGSAEAQAAKFPDPETFVPTDSVQRVQYRDPLTPAAAGDRAPVIETRRCNPARRHNFWLGGKDNFVADRVSANAITDLIPEVPTIARANRQFLHHVVSSLAAAGVRQFVDLGCGFPTQSNTHDIAQAAIPDARVVYVDRDPLVLAHTRALMTSTPQGKVAVVDADLRQPHAILSSTALRETIDLTQPVAWLLLAVLHYLGDETDLHSIVRELVQVSPEHSYVAISHATLDGLSQQVVARLKVLANTEPVGIQARSRDDVTRLVDGLHLQPPGICPVRAWYATNEVRDDQHIVGMYTVVGRKPRPRPARA